MCEEREKRYERSTRATEVGGAHREIKGPARRAALRSRTLAP